MTDTAPMRVAPGDAFALDALCEQRCTECACGALVYGNADGAYFTVDDGVARALPRARACTECCATACNERGCALRECRECGCEQCVWCYGVGALCEQCAPPLRVPQNTPVAASTLAARASASASASASTSASTSASVSTRW